MGVPGQLDDLRCERDEVDPLDGFVCAETPACTPGSGWRGPGLRTSERFKTWMNHLVARRRPQLMGEYANPDTIRHSG